MGAATANVHDDIMQLLVGHGMKDLGGDDDGRT